MKAPSVSYEAVVVGASAGGMTLIKKMVSSLPAGFLFPVIIVQHTAVNDGFWPNYLNDLTPLQVKEADEKEQIKAGYIYLAPANYHLLIENDRTFTLTVDERVNYARPSIDILFETAADAYRKKLIGIILTGSNFDGAKGLKKIQDYGGMVVIQEPKTAEAIAMPKAAINMTKPDYILEPEKINELLIKIHENGGKIYEI